MSTEPKRGFPDTVQNSRPKQAAHGYSALLPSPKHYNRSHRCRKPSFAEIFGKSRPQGDLRKIVLGVIGIEVGVRQAHI